MKFAKQWLFLFILALAIAGVTTGIMLTAYADPHVQVDLRDANGNFVSATGNPYSPKWTCNVVGCHSGFARDYGLESADFIYESDLALARKDHGPGTPVYEVPYPLHGVSAGFHFQQGRNISWNSDNDNAQRRYYGLPDFTSSPGMYGKY